MSTLGRTLIPKAKGSDQETKVLRMELENKELECALGLITRLQSPGLGEKKGIQEQD